MKKFIKKHWKLILVALYIVSPVDFIADVVPVLGFSDDALVLVLTIISKLLDKKKEKTVIEGEIIDD